MLEPRPVRPWYHRHAALLALAVLLAVQHLVAFLGGAEDAAWQRDATVPTTADRLTNVTVHPVSGVFSVTWFDVKQLPAIEWRDVGLDGARFVQLRLKSLHSCDWASCYLQYISPDEPPHHYDDTMLRERTVRPVVKMRGDVVTLQWHLLRPAASFRLLLPDEASFTVLDLQAAGLPWEAYRRQSRGEVLRFLLTALSAALLLTWLGQHLGSVRQLLTRPVVVSCVILGTHGVLMLWLLPPFQGPDENRHWRAALGMFRGDAGPGSLLRELPNLLGAEEPRWRCEVPYPAQPLRGTAQRPPPQADASPVGYAGPWGYPVVGFVSLFFPRVDTLNEALLFYYACRLVPLAVLLFLIAGLWRAGLGSWTLVFFLSLPLVLQQMMVVSTDTVMNLCTLAALLLSRRPRQGWSLVGLTLLVLLVVLAKPPIYAVLLVVVLWHVAGPWLWRPAVVLGLVATLVIAGVAGYFALWAIVERAGDGFAHDARQQLTWLLTWPGLQAFALGLLEYPTRFLYPEYWWAPLGWLDTPLGDVHKRLLWVNLLVAVSLDLVRGGPRLVEHWRAAASGIGVTVLYVLFTWITPGAIMYLTITPPKVDYIVGMQVRYMIPVVLFTLLWPLILVRYADSQGPTGPARRPRRVWRVAPAFLLTLAAARAIQLAGDLHYRYWG